MTQSSTGSDPLVWVERYGDYLYGFALMRVRSGAAAEDLVQETFLAAIESRSFAGKSAEKTWLVGILKHKIYDYYRRASREENRSAENASDAATCDYMFERQDEYKNHWNDNYAPAEWHETPLEAVEKGEFQVVLTGCLSKLPARAANAFTLREIDGLSGREVCEMLEISTSNFWVLMHRARTHLRQCLEVNWFQSGERGEV